MTIKMAHLRAQGIDFAVFGADARSGMSSDRAGLLADLMIRARNSGFKVDKAALAYTRGRRVEFYGTPDLVKYLASMGGVPRWTHTITV